MRYRVKRMQRTFRRELRYKCRRVIADRRLRVKGRFVSSEDENILKGLGQVISKVK